MDFRPIDTIPTINTRNLIRTASVVNLILLLFYISIEEYITGAHISNIHQFHLILQPIVLFASLAESTALMLVTIIAVLVSAVIDGAILFLNFTSVSRCLAEPTASCFELLWEKGVLSIIAGSHVIADTLLILRLWTLNKAMDKKDIHEKAASDSYKSNESKEAPILKTVRVLNAKLRIIHAFVLLPGAIFSYQLSYKAMENGLSNLNILYIAAAAHIVIDLYGLAASGSHNRDSMILLVIAYIAAAAVNVISGIMLLGEKDRGIMDNLTLLISGMYIFSDILVLYFGFLNISYYDKFDKFKKL